MWFSGRIWDMTQAELMVLRDERARLIEETTKQQTIVLEARTQKAKDDITIDWMRHRVNALEKMNAILLAKAAGVHVPIPEIVPTRPGTMTVPNFESMPSFEDAGDEEAARLGLEHDELGQLSFTK